MGKELPSLVIVGRPNVGKSTLFNRLTGTRRAIVTNEPGITRDRIYGKSEWRGRVLEIVDTGGIVPDDKALIPTEILRQARVAIEKAALLVLVVDSTAGLTPLDQELARLLRTTGRPFVVAVNKVDSTLQEVNAGPFHALGVPVFPIAAEHGTGVDDLLDEALEQIKGQSAEEQPEPQKAVEIAIIGRPNVGKSTLLNRMADEERSIVSPIPGTTMDSVDTEVVKNGKLYRFVDTAGIRRKGKTKLMAEKLSVVMARRHLRMCNVAMLVMDAQEGVLALDATIAGYAHEEGRAVVLVVNKSDIAKEGKRKFEEEVRDHLKFLDYATVAFVSAKQKQGMRGLFGLVKRAFEFASKRETTGQLNRFIATLHWEYDMKIYYMTQGSVRPPTFVVFTDKAKDLHFSSERFLINQLRKRFGFEGTPIRIKAKRR